MARGPADLSLHEPNKFREPPSGKGQTAPLPSEVKAKTATAEFKGQDGNDGTQQLGKAKGKITGIRLAYNELKSLDGLDEALSAVMDDPVKNLQFLDLSHNKLTEISEVLLKYQNIAVLYLHGNNFSSLRLVQVLNGLKNLRKITLHGNPSYFPSFVEGSEVKLRNQPTLEADPWYRVGITWMLRDTLLQSIDFITITPKDRKTASIWAAGTGSTKLFSKQRMKTFQGKKDQEETGAKLPTKAKKTDSKKSVSFGGTKKVGD